MWQQEDDGSVVDGQDRVLYLSRDRFVATICEGDHCFICGASPAKKHFNDEHVIPAWLLRKFKLFDRPIQLPNGSQIRYDRYKVRCCLDCNELMGRDIETPVRELVSAGYEAIRDRVAEAGGLLLFIWMGLIFLKTHLRDANLRMSRDLRCANDPISKEYDWEGFHHLYTVARSFYSGVEIGEGVGGTLLVLPAKTEDDADRFDYADLYATQVALLRMDDVALLAIFNDSGACHDYLTRSLDGVTGPLLLPQLRELMVEAALCNSHLASPPRYRLKLDLEGQTHQVVAKLPRRWKFEQFDLAVRGRLMAHAFDDLIRGRNISGGEDEQEVRQDLCAGRTTFLFAQSGRFINKSREPGV
jgi:hypothetical protein